MRCFEIEGFCPLRPEDYNQDPSKISPATEQYNCIAFALGETTKPWWPSKRLKDDYEWPEHLGREEEHQETLQNFVRAFETRRYRLCKDGKLQPGIEKIALFVSPLGNPLHAALQLESGVWKSKCGDYQDIEHSNVNFCNAYGRAVAYMRRRRDGKPFWIERIKAFLPIP
jgi:hypothetical protein